MRPLLVRVSLVHLKGSSHAGQLSCSSCANLTKAVDVPDKPLGLLWSVIPGFLPDLSSQGFSASAHRNLVGGGGCSVPLTLLPPEITTTKNVSRYCQMPPGGQPPPSEKHCPKPLPAFCPRCHWSRASSEKVGITSGSNSDGWPGEFTTRNLSQKKESPYLSKHIKVYVRDTS